MQHSTSQCRKFTKNNRLLDAPAYKRVFASRHKGTIGGLKWFALTNQATNARLGLAVPKRCIRTATRRNRLKRILRESFRCNQEILSGFDIVVVVRRPIDGEQYLRTDLAKIWSRVSEIS